VPIGTGHSSAEGERVEVEIADGQKGPAAENVVKLGQYVRRPASIPQRLRVIEVRLGDDDRIEWALKAFKRKVLKAGILKDVRKKRHYLKPSEARQLKAAAARRNARAKNRASR
jgi:small subunit ribosomal protein S21